MNSIGCEFDLSKTWTKCFFCFRIQFSDERTDIWLQGNWRFFLLSQRQFLLPQIQGIATKRNFQILCICDSNIVHVIIKFYHNISPIGGFHEKKTHIIEWIEWKIFDWKKLLIQKTAIVEWIEWQKIWLKKFNNWGVFFLLRISFDCKAFVARFASFFLTMQLLTFLDPILLATRSTFLYPFFVVFSFTIVAYIFCEKSQHKNIKQKRNSNC